MVSSTCWGAFCCFLSSNITSTADSSSDVSVRVTFSASASLDSTYFSGTWFDVFVWLSTSKGSSSDVSVPGTSSTSASLDSTYLLMEISCNVIFFFLYQSFKNFFCTLILIVPSIPSKGIPKQHPH